MRTKEEELAKLDAEVTRKKQELDSKYAVMALLPDLGEYVTPSIHHFRLYGSVGSIIYRHERYESIRSGKNPDVRLLRTLLAAHPPESVIMTKDGCTSFKPEPESYTNNGNITEVDPLVLDLQPNDSISVKWWTTLNGELWRMEVEFPSYNAKLGNLSIHYKAKLNGEDSARIESCDFYPVRELNAHRIRWATGDYSGKTLNRFTIYWERGRNVDVASLFE